MYQLQAPLLQRHFETVARGTAQKGVYLKTLSETPIRVAPLQLQARIVAEIEKQFTRLEAGVAGLRRVQAKLKRYRAAVLKAACEGKLVPTEACLRQAERGRQAELARQEGRTLPAPRPGVFFVYAIRCDNDSIYIGQTQDLQKRWKEHLAGQASDWTSQHKPLLIVHHEEYSSREEAVAREKWLKTGFGRKWIRREIAAGRLPAEQAGARQAGFESGAQLLERILAERRQKWNGKGKYKEPARPDTGNLRQLPEGWTWARIEQLAERVQYGSSAKTNDDSSGTPVLRMGNIQDGKFDFDKLKYLPKTHDEFPELLLMSGDLLFNRTNSAELVGKTAVYKGSPHPCSFASYLIRVRLFIGCIPDFVSYFINSVFGRAWVTAVVSQQVGQANVNGTKLQALAVPVPPFTEQRRIVNEVERCLSVVDELEAVVNANLQRATRLRQSILKKAFSGFVA
jgi:restriction endonuclease S subunit/predicted GIY-YIG superfamily endonuclease